MRDGRNLNVHDDLKRVYDTLFEHTTKGGVTAVSPICYFNLDDMGDHQIVINADHVEYAKVVVAENTNTTNTEAPKEEPK